MTLNARNAQVFFTNDDIFVGLEGILDPPPEA